MSTGIPSEQERAMYAVRATRLLRHCSVEAILFHLADLMAAQWRGSGVPAAQHLEVQLKKIDALGEALRNGERFSRRTLDAKTAAAVRLDIVRSIAIEPPGSTSRGLAIREAARRLGVSVRTVRRWVRTYEQAGRPDRKPRADRGRRRVLISRLWSSATADIPRPVRERIAADLVEFIRATWRSGAFSGRHVACLATTHLIEATRAAGFAGSEEALKAACNVPRRVVEAERPKKERT